MEIGINLIGIIAGALTTFAQLPQIGKILKTKSVDDISIGMYLMLILGVVLWIIYGAMIRSIPVILTNSVALCLIGAVAVFKLRYARY